MPSKYLSSSTRRPAFIAPLLALGCAACASAPEHLYSLERPASEFSSPATGPAPQTTVLINSVSVPSLVDRPQLVVREGSYKIKVNEQERWGTPLKEQLPRVLAAQLSARVPAIRFVPAGSAALNAPSAHLSVDFSHIDLGPNGMVDVSAHWVYRSTGSQPNISEGDSRGRAEVRDSTYPAYVDALLRASESLADDMSRRLAN